MVRLGEDFVFPSPRSADSHGIVAYGGDLNPQRIIQAYKNGIFPWFESDNDLLWWSPDPRMILYPEKIKVSKSLKSFIKLHEMGLAISVEVWKNSEIVGGLYGLDLGDVFCGESMFSKSTNASKLALVSLSLELKKNSYRFIDCQVPSQHLKSMGAEEISRDEFLKILIK